MPNAEKGVITNVGLAHALAANQNGWNIDITRFAVSEYERIEANSLYDNITTLYAQIGDNVVFGEEAHPYNHIGQGVVKYVNLTTNEIQVEMVSGYFEVNAKMHFGTLTEYPSGTGSASTITNTSLDPARLTDNLLLYKGSPSSFVTIAPDLVQVNVEIPENANTLKSFTVASATGAVLHESVAFSADDVNTTAVGVIREITGTTIKVFLESGEISNGDNIEWDATVYATGDTTINSAVSNIAITDNTPIREIYLYSNNPEMIFKDVTITSGDEDNIDLFDPISFTDLPGLYKEFTVVSAAGAVVGQDVAWSTGGTATDGHGEIIYVSGTTIRIIVNSGTSPLNGDNLDWNVIVYASSDTTINSGITDWSYTKGYGIVREKNANILGVQIISGEVENSDYVDFHSKAFIPITPWKEFTVADDSLVVLGQNVAWSTGGTATDGYGSIEYHDAPSNTIRVLVASGTEPLNGDNLDFNVTVYASSDTTINSAVTNHFDSNSLVTGVADNSTEAGEELFYVGVPNNPIPYQSTSIVTFEVQIQMTNIQNILEFTSTQATEIINHNTDPNAHPNLASLVSNLEFTPFTGSAPTYVSAYNFTVTGDQTSLFIPGRAIKADLAGDGIVYSYVKESTFGAVTTVRLDHACLTVNLNAGGIDYGILATGAMNDGTTDPKSSLPLTNTSFLSGMHQEEVIPVGDVRSFSGQDMYVCTVGADELNEIAPFQDVCWSGDSGTTHGVGFIKYVAENSDLITIIWVSGTRAPLAGDEFDFGVTTWAVADATIAGAPIVLDAPIGWLVCRGQTLAKASYGELFATIGYTFGGSGANFILPDLRGRTPIGYEQGQDTLEGGVGTDRDLGDKDGTEKHTLTINQMPAHTHPSDMWKWRTPEGSTWSEHDMRTSRGGGKWPDQVSKATGGGGSHENMSPSLAMKYIIKYRGSV
jgi:microcystin-dependent protein